MLVPPRHILGGGGTEAHTVGGGGYRGAYSGVGGTKAHTGGGGHRGAHSGLGQAACIMAGGKYGSSIRKAPARHWLAQGPVLGGCHLAARPMCPL